MAIAMHYIAASLHMPFGGNHPFHVYWEGFQSHLLFLNIFRQIQQQRFNVLLSSAPSLFFALYTLLHKMLSKHSEPEYFEIIQVFVPTQIRS